MKKILVVFLITLAFCLTATAQTAKSNRPALPSNLAKFVDEYPDKLMKVAAVKSRLKSLLGKKYATFNSYLTVEVPIKRVGDFIFASGCLPHSCTVNESAFAIDLKNKRIHTVIYDKGKSPKYFNEDSAATPQLLIDWVNELKAM